MKNMEETQVKCDMIWEIWKKSKLKCEMIWKIWKIWKKNIIFFYKTISTACNLFKFTLCSTVRGNNSVSEGINL